MNFVQLEYPIFLTAIVSIIAMTRSLSLRKAITLAASYYFYAYWDYRFLGLLVASTIFDYLIGLALHRATSTSIRKSLLLLSIFGNLGVLGFFKYYNFFIESAEAIFSRWGLGGGTLAILLPIGISFYTFQTLSYSIDVYRRKILPCRSLLDFAIYVSFFPQLVAGPIVRASEFLPQLDAAPVVNRQHLYDGAMQVFRGFLKKVLIADHLAVFVDPVFASPTVFSSLTILLAIVAYTGQIYGDFSGYSDIAIGSARMLGFDLPENFRHPYLSTSIADFWRRWHITLSTWLRDYLYIPLGGNRHGSPRTYLNLMATMILGGLWHGAAWTFVLWGVWHGAALCLMRSSNSSRRGSLLSGIITFAIVVIGWTLFRATSLENWGELMGSLLTNARGFQWTPPAAMLALTILILEHAIWSSRYQDVLLLKPDRWYTPWIVGFGLAALLLFAPQSSKPFVYFQF